MTKLLNEHIRPLLLILWNGRYFLSLATTSMYVLSNHINLWPFSLWYMDSLRLWYQNMNIHHFNFWIRIISTILHPKPFRSYFVKSDKISDSIKPSFNKILIVYSEIFAYSKSFNTLGSTVFFSFLNCYLSASFFRKATI